MTLKQNQFLDRAMVALIMTGCFLLIASFFQKVMPP